MATVSTMLFDLGGVLFQLSGAAVVCRWTRDRLTPPELMKKWLASPAVRDFESGRIDFSAFRARLKQELLLAVDDEEFAAVFKGWITGAFPGAEDLLTRLSARYSLACFSNTNAVHWEILTRDYNVLGFFDKAFASFQMGLVKPDAEAFVHVVEGLGVPAGSIVFFDDSQANVAAAQQCGLRAFCVAGVAGVAAAVEEAGLL